MYLFLMAAFKCFHWVQQFYCIVSWCDFVSPVVGALSFLDLWMYSSHEIWRVAYLVIICSRNVCLFLNVSLIGLFETVPQICVLFLFSIPPCVLHFLDHFTPVSSSLLSFLLLCLIHGDPIQHISTY